jgi:hypothetical protein
MDFNDVLHGHVSLEIDCVDRVLLDAGVPDLETTAGGCRVIDKRSSMRAPSRHWRRCEDHWGRHAHRGSKGGANLVDVVPRLLQVLMVLGALAVLVPLGRR